MADVSLEWNGDFQASATGDLALADGDDLSRQQIIRRLMTAINGYVFHLDYGAGLPQKIGSPARQREIESVIRSQIALEASVDASKPVQIKVTEDQNQFHRLLLSRYGAGGAAFADRYFLRRARF
jgi:hypothetical protein